MAWVVFGRVSRCSAGAVPCAAPRTNRRETFAALNGLPGVQPSHYTRQAQNNRCERRSTGHRTFDRGRDYRWPPQLRHPCSLGAAAKFSRSLQVNAPKHLFCRNMPLDHLLPSPNVVSEPPCLKGASTAYPMTALPVLATCTASDVHGRTARRRARRHRLTTDVGAAVAYTSRRYLRRLYRYARNN